MMERQFFFEDRHNTVMVIGLEPCQLLFGVAWAARDLSIRFLWLYIDFEWDWDADSGDEEYAKADS